MLAPTTRPSLLVRIRDTGDTLSWTTFVEVYGRAIHRFCRGRGLQDADALEVMQEVLLEVHRGIGRFAYDSNRGRFRSWLGTIVRRRLTRLRNRRRPQPSLDDVREPVASDDWSESLQRHLLETALERIRPRFRPTTWRAFARTWLDDAPAGTVAAELGRSVDWVYVARCRVLLRLREEVRQLSEEVPAIVRVSR